MALGIVVIAAAALRLHGVATQPLIGDEEWAAATAVHYVESGQLGPTMWYHPPLRNLGLWAIGEAFGWGAVALRATSVALGILTVPLLAALVLLLTGDRTASLVAAFLLAFDQVHLTFSRQAIQETWTTFFFVAGTVAAVAAWTRRAPGWLAVAGLAFGLGLSSKLHALFPLAACGAAGLWIARRERSPALAAWVVASLALLPGLVFLASYLPWFARGYGLGDWIELQRVLLVKTATHSGNPMDQTIDVGAWQWFLRPMGYANFVISGARPHVTVAFSNPVIWLAVLPATWMVGREALQDRTDRAGVRFALLLFAASYLPLALSSRPIWLLSALGTIPFAFAIVGLGASMIARARPWGPRALAAWAAVAAAVSLALYPLAAGEGEPDGYLRPIVERFRPASDAPPGR